MENLEIECEDVLYELCELRELYPAYCANKLSKILRLSSEIKSRNMKANLIHIDKLEGPLKLDDKKQELFENFMSNLSNQSKSTNKSMKTMLENINDLIEVTQEISKKEHCSLNKCLKQFTRNINNN